MFFSFFLKVAASTEIYTLSLHDALPICWRGNRRLERAVCREPGKRAHGGHRDEPARVAQLRAGQQSHRVPHRENRGAAGGRSEEHTSELQSRQYLVCRLLLEKKKHRYMI